MKILRFFFFALYTYLCNKNKIIYHLLTVYLYIIIDTIIDLLSFKNSFGKNFDKAFDKKIFLLTIFGVFLLINFHLF